MARPNQTTQRRRELLPVVARTFAELGYRRTTTAELARRCRVRQNILYRLWPDKRGMFIAAIGYVYELSAQIWKDLLSRRQPDATPAERLLEYEAQHHGEFGLYRIVFAGLSETDDPQIRDALRRMYDRFHRFICRQIADHRDRLPERARPAAELSAWAVIGLGTVANVVRELDLLTDRRRRRLIVSAGRLLLTGASD
jgi:AcrR family transcriptional regulator